MAKELQIRHTNAAVGVYAQVRNATGDIWNGSAFEGYATANVANYDVALIEKGESQVFTGTFPAAIAAGIYHIFVWDGAAGAPAEADVYVTDYWVEWNGSILLPRAAWASVDVVDVGKGREWIVERDGRVAPTLSIAPTDSVTLSMDFTRFFNPETAFATADSVVDQSVNALTTSNVVLSGDKKKIFFDVAAADLTAALTYTMRCAGTTTDGNTISADGALQTRA